MNTLLEYTEEQFLADELAPELLASALPDEFAQRVVERLKQESDRYWYIDPERSLLLADRIVAIGTQRGDRRQTALGLLARGNALKFKGQLTEAWNELTRAGETFLAADDETGWARTRISRLELSIKLNHVSEALAEADHASEIFLRRDNQEMLMRLYYTMASMHNYLGDQSKVLRLINASLSIAESLGANGDQFVAPLYTVLGNVYVQLGEFDHALTQFERARRRYAERHEIQNIALIEVNMALVAQARGQYRRALGLFHHALEQLESATDPNAVAARRNMLECYLNLNRFSEASQLARRVLGEAREQNDQYVIAGTLLHLATAEAELTNFESARRALDQAEEIFSSLGAAARIAEAQSRRARLALKEHEPAVAYQAAVSAASHFESDRQQVNSANAIMLQAQALKALGNAHGACAASRRVLQVAQHFNVPALRHGAHLLLGQLEEARGDTARASRHYQAAMATVDRVQRGLTITLRPGFLEDKNEAMHALIAMQLRLGQSANAFETLERAKSQVLLGYVLNRERLHWRHADERDRWLVDELNHLRAEHHRLYQLAHEPPDGSSSGNAIPPDQALLKVAEYERRMRAITEQLYIRSGDDERAGFIPATALSDVQRSLSDETVLVEYYNDGNRLWAFVLDGNKVEVQPLPITTGGMNQLLMQLQAHLAAALRLDSHARAFTLLAQRLLRRLYSMLIEPLALEKHGRRRLVVVPYGALHYLPFHLLYDGGAYVIDSYEVVSLPAAALATRRSPPRARGALVLTHSWAGRLPNTRAEGQMVQRLFGGALYAEAEAQRAVFQETPMQILHIAAHGQHRLDQPDLSYLELGDGLLQQDLSYELVTLSGCETGRARVAASEELIGLGRGFLYAGAGALLVSLWPVADDSTLRLMEYFYQSLRAGETKAAALRAAQRLLRSEDPHLHPAFWGAFELIGDAGALSVDTQASTQLVFDR